MPNNLQFLDDPDDVPSINENIVLHVGVDGSDETNSGLSDSPFRTLGKAVDVLRNKIIEKNNLVTIQLGKIKTDRTGKNRKYFEEEAIKIDFESAKRLKIKGEKPTDHEVVGISYYDKATDRDGYYCQILVTNQDKINIGDYLAVYDHFKFKKKDPSYFWTYNSIRSPVGRSVTPNNCYVESIRQDMIMGVHEVVDVSATIEHDGIHSDLPTELFYPENLKVGTVTLFVKNNNHTYKRLNEVPFWNSLGTVAKEPIYTYAAGAGNSPLEAKQNNSMPPILYGAEMLSNPETAESQGFEQFYYSNPIQQVELVDIMVRGYQFSLSPLNGKIIDPRSGKASANTEVLWNDKTLTGTNRVIVAISLASYFYKKIIQDLRIDRDLPFYFGKTTDPFVTNKQVVTAAKKIRDYLLNGARQIKGIPSWDEDNHPGYGFGPFESGAVRNPIGGGAPTDTTSYPSEYADPTRLSLLLRYYNIYPPVNGQLYQPTLIKRIRSWYNDNGTRNGMQLDRWEKKGNQSPFFCGYITPQGWYKQRYAANPGGTGIGEATPSLTSNMGDPNGYYRLFGADYPNYVGNTLTEFNKIEPGARGAFSNDRSSTRNLLEIDTTIYRFETAGLTNAGLSGSTAYALKGSMGTVWYSGLVNYLNVGTEGSGRGLGKLGGNVLDRYSLGYLNGSQITTNDNIQDKTTAPVLTGEPFPVQIIYDVQTSNVRAKCFKSVLRFSGNGIKVCEKVKLGLIKDVCLVNIDTRKKSRSYGLMADQEAIINASNIAVSSFDCGISARNQSLINLLSDLGDSPNPENKGILSAIDPGAIVTANGIGIESSLKSHVNAQRTLSSGSKTANYLSIANSSMNCSNTMSVSGFKHGYVCEFNSYMKAINTFSEFNAGIGYCAANNSILVCHRSRSIWNGSHGVLANTKSTIKCYEFITRSNEGDGILAQHKSTVSAGANSSKFANYRREILGSGISDGSNTSYFGAFAMLPPHMYQITVFAPQDVNNPIRLPVAAKNINSNPTHSTNVLYHECNSTIAEFNAGSGFAAETDSTIIADNTISRYNSKRHGEFFIFGWSGVRSSFPTDTLTPFEGDI